MKPNLWKFTLRRLAICKSERTVSSEYVVLRATTEREAVLELKANKFTVAWWDEHLVIAVEHLGELWYLAAEVQAVRNG